MNYNLGDIVTMKKVHPCGSYDFEIIRLGADVKIRCVNKISFEKDPLISMLNYECNEKEKD